MFLWLLIALSTLTLAVGAWVWQRADPAPAGQTAAVSPKPAPDFSLPAADGEVVRLSDLEGKVVLLNFWATWCPPCNAEMPDLEALYRAYGAEQDFVVLGVNLQEERAAVEAYARAIGITFPLLIDADGAVTTDRYAVRTLPMSFIIGRDGQIRDAWTGRLSERAMVERLKSVW